MIKQSDKANEARAMYWQGYKLREIEEKLGIPYATLYSRKTNEKWDDASVATKIATSIEARLARLIAKETKTMQDLAEVQTLTDALVKTSRIEKHEATQKESDLNPNIKRRNSGKKKKPKSVNFLNDDQIKQLEKAFLKIIFPYQEVWYANRHRRIRNLLKSRQIGATYYFALEAIIGALKGGNNKIFISASKAQAHVFKQYIVDFVYDEVGVKLVGDPIKLGHNGATLYFLGTNSKTAQSYHGDVYFDEYFWTLNFVELRKVSSAMALQKQYHQTYISTPSTIGHQAYPFWTGAAFNKGKSKANRVEIDVSHKNLAPGMMCADGQWRQVLTVEDAVAQGCNLIDIEQLRLEYSEDDFKNLLMCIFVDDADSVFGFDELKKCMVDSWEVWTDFTALSKRPLGKMPVWIGYDPSRSCDNASVVVVAPPLVAGGKFRIVEKHSWNDMDFDTQARHIKKLTKKYNVQHMAIDISGIGYGVYELVKKFYPGTKALKYSVELKTKMVLKAKQLISHRRLEFDQGWRDLAMAFMTIHKASTSTGRHITYQSSRTAETGHADLAWATMHALLNEPLQDIESTGGGSRIEMEVL